MIRAAITIARLRKHGCRIPIICYQEAKRARLDVAVLAAVLEQETGGGRNVFGHDPTIFVGAGNVTKAKYLAYKKRRGRRGKGGMQGVGPMQLTWFSYQDFADKLGGCWKPRLNVRVGAELLARNIRLSGELRAFQLYNGSAVYARQVAARVRKWRRVLR